MIKACILDFDGIILETVDTKADAFRQLFKDYPEYLKAILDYHYANGGVSRFEKFKFIYKDILNLPLSEKQFQTLCDRFAQLVYQKVVEAIFVPGAKEFLDVHFLKYDLYIVSGTPDQEIKSIVKDRGLQKYFKGVYGSPLGKVHWTRQIIKEKGYSSQEIVWVGDALSDLEAAQDSRIPFIARVEEGRANVFNTREPYCFIKDLEVLGRTIEQLERKSLG